MCAPRLSSSHAPPRRRNTQSWSTQVNATPHSAAASFEGREERLLARAVDLPNRRQEGRRRATHGTPTHSYMKGLYKYPHAPFPYLELVTENQRRGPDDAEYELDALVAKLLQQTGAEEPIST